MSKLGLLIASTSLLALGGCATMRSYTKTGRANDEQAKKLQWTNDSVERAQKRTMDGLPTDREKLADAYDAWVDARRSLLSFANDTSYANQELGNCFTGKRKDNEYCRKAKDGIATAEQTMVEILKAGLTATPSTTSAFPAQQLAIATADPALSKALNAEDAFAMLADRQASHFAKRLKKAGGARSLVRKADEGMCFFSTSPHGDEVHPAFLFDTSADELFVRCIAPEPLRSYERTQNDSIAIELIGRDGWESVKQLWVSEMSADETSEFTVPVSALSKFAVGRHEDWSHVPIQVRYVVNKKDGVREVTSNNGEVRYVDNIDDRTVARGIVVLQVKGELGSDEETDETDDEADDEAPDEGKKTKRKISKRADREDAPRKDKRKTSKRAERDDDNEIDDEQDDRPVRRKSKRADRDSERPADERASRRTARDADDDDADEDEDEEDDEAPVRIKKATKKRRSR